MFDCKDMPGSDKLKHSYNNSKIIVLPLIDLPLGNTVLQHNNFLNTTKLSINM